jgi:dienelactone hydrolase
MAEQTLQILERSVVIPPVNLQGDLVAPFDAWGVALFAHGSGSSRHSSRNRYVAGILQQSRMATLLLDLLTEREEEADRDTGEWRFDIRLLAGRLSQAIDWLSQERETQGLPVGLFGASTGGAAALVTAAQRREVAAVVSRGGRPDLAGEALQKVTAPTLLIVGALDQPVIELNELARREMRAKTRVEIVPGASHLFEEPGKLHIVARLAAEWFQRHMPHSTLNR